MEPAAEAAVREALWRRVESDFASDETHHRFLEHCRKHGQLAEAARRYRHYLNGLEADAEARVRAVKHLAAVAALAVAELEAARPTQPSGRHPLITALTVITTLLFVAAVALLLRELTR